jgi:hypothetical protein
MYEPLEDDTWDDPIPPDVLGGIGGGVDWAKAERGSRNRTRMRSNLLEHLLGSRVMVTYRSRSGVRKMGAGLLIRLKPRPQKIDFLLNVFQFGRLQGQLVLHGVKILEDLVHVAITLVHDEALQIIYPCDMMIRSTSHV